MITGEAHLVVRSSREGLTHAHVTRGTDALGHTGIAVLGFGNEIHGLPTGLVGETGTVGHQVAGDEFLGGGGATHGTHGHAVAGTMHGTICLIVVATQDDFVGEVGYAVRVEQLEVAGMKAIAAGLDEFLGNLGALFQIPFIVMGIGREGLEEYISCVILAEGSFEQQETGLQGHGGPFGHLIGALGRRKVRDSEVNVFDHLAHNELAAVAGTVQFVDVGRTNGVFVPRNIAEALYLFKIDIGAEETGQGLELGAHGGIRAMIQIVQKRIHIAQGTPAPATAAGRDGTLTHALVGHVVLGVMVVIGHIEALTGEVLVEHDGESPEFTFTLEESVLGELVLGNGIQKVVAAGKSEPGKHKQDRE